MKYIIKNEEVERAVRGLFKNKKTFEFRLQKVCEEDFSDNSASICLHIVKEASVTNTSLNIYIHKSDIEEIHEYNPNGWNKYPDVRPSKNGLYLITRKNGAICTYVYAKQFNEFCGVDDDVAAFRELPEPFQE